MPPTRDDVPGAPLRAARLSYVFVDVLDLVSMRAFYADTLGLPVLFESPGECVFLGSPGGPAVALYPGRTAPVGPGAVLVAFDVADLPACATALTAQGVAVSEVQNVPGGRAAFFVDPEGNRLEIHQPST